MTSCLVRAVSSFGVFILSLVALSWEASAHLMPSGRGTINLVGAKAYLVLSLPVRAFDGVEACRDGRLTPEELALHEGALRAVVRERVVVEATAGRASFERVLLNLPEGPDHLGEELVVMVVANLGAAPSSVVLSVDLWSGDDGLTIKATVSDSRRTTMSEVGVLTPGAPSHTFFASGGSTFASWLWRGFAHLTAGLDHLAFMVLMFAAAVARRRWAVLMMSFGGAYGAAMTFAAQGAPVPDADVVELVIALSLGLLAAVYLIGGVPRLRLEVLVVATAGLAHGLGFAEALRGDTHLPVLKLVGFNLGAAIAQVAVAGAVLGAWWLGRRFVPGLARAAFRTLAVATLVLGLVLMTTAVARIFTSAAG